MNKKQSVSLIDGHIDGPTMTDEQIISALEWCEHFENNLVLSGKIGEKFTLALQALQTIRQVLKDFNRQKAEIERLKKENDQFADIGKMYSVKEMMEQ